jgi:hypothetical protein
MPLDPPPDDEEDAVSLGVGSEAGAPLLLSFLLPLSVVVPVATAAPLVVLDDDAVEVEEVEEEVVDAEDSADRPQTLGPELRSAPMRLNTALLAPSPFGPCLTLCQHGVADVKLRRTGTVALNPGAFCW